MRKGLKLLKQLICIFCALMLFSVPEAPVYSASSGVEILEIVTAVDGEDLLITVNFKADNANKQVVLVMLPGMPDTIDTDSLRNESVWMGQFMPTKESSSNSYFSKSFRIERPNVSPANYTVYMSAAGSTTKTYKSVLFEEFTVNYYDKDGTTLLGTEKLSKGAKLDAKDVMKSRVNYSAGCEFSGWINLSDDSPVENVEKSVNVRATEKIISYTVTYKDFDGIIIGSAELSHGSDIDPQLNMQNKLGISDEYLFCGWVDANNTVITKVFSDITVTATRKRKMYEVRYFALDGVTELAVRSIAHGTKVDEDGSIRNLIQNDISEGYEFGGWFDISTGAEISFVTANVSVKATERVRTFRVIYLDTDEETKLYEERVSEGAVLDNAKIAQKKVTLSSNYIFDGWVDESGIEVTKGKNRDMTVTATQAKASGGNSSGGGGSGGGEGSTSYTVYYELNGGQGETVSSVERNHKITKPANPVRDGYRFDGWYEDAALTKEYDFNTVATKSVTLYAKWTKNETDFSDEEYMTNEIPFTDVFENDWFYKNVKGVYNLGFMNGVSEKTFAPNAALTRGMFVTILHRIENNPMATKFSEFTDVTEHAYYSDAVAWAVENNIVTGISEDTFAPDNMITREQMAVILWRYLKTKDKEVSGSVDLEYSDNAVISSYAIDAVKWADKCGIMKGNDDGSFAPQKNATRAEAASVFVRFFELMK